METKYVKHYILDTFNDNDGRVIRTMDLSGIVSRYELVSDRIKKALLANDIPNPEQYIKYSFRMLGEYRDGVFNRKELMEVNLDELREHLDEFPWEDWGWVEAFQPLVDVAGFTIVEIDSEYQSFGNIPISPEDYIPPCFRIYEGGAPDWDVYERYQKNSRQRRRHDDEPIDIEPEPAEPPPPHKGWFGEVSDAFKENVPTVLAVITAATAITVMLRTAQNAADVAAESARRSEEILRHIEDSIDDAIDMPQVVRVELGEDIEVVGTGRRTW